MESIEKILRETTEENQSKVDWTSAWSGKYPILKQYQGQVDLLRYAGAIQALLEQLQKEYGYSELDAMLVLKDIIAHVYLDSKHK